MNPGTSEVPVDYEPIARAWEWLFLGWIAFIPLMVGFSVRFLNRYSLPFADLLFVGALAAFLAAVLCGVRRLRPCTWYRPLLVYAGALILSTLGSEDVGRSAPKLAGDLYLILAAALAVNYATSLKYFRRVVFAWLAGTTASILAAAAGLFLFYTGAATIKTNPFLLHYFGTLPAGHYPRVRALFFYPNMMCAYMVVSIMLTLGARQAGWISGRAFRLLLLGGIVAAAFSLSPELGGLFLALCLWPACRQPNRTATRLIAATGIAAALAVFMVTTVSLTPLARTSLAQTFLHPEPSGRVLTWVGGWHTFLGRPWTGRGLGLNAASVHYLTASGQRQTLTVAHNTWLSVMAQQGSAGLLGFAWVVFCLVRRFRLFGQLCSVTAVVRASLELALIGGFLYQTLVGAYENTRFVWALMGLVAAVQELSVEIPATTAGLIGPECNPIYGESPEPGAQRPAGVVRCGFSAEWGRTTRP